MKKLTILTFFIALSVISLAQDSSGYKEKISLHSNSAEFNAGESILFSVLCMDKDNNLNSVCKTAYVVLVDTERNSILNMTVSLKNGVGNGELVIPANLGSGSYSILCYSDWIRENDSENIFSKDVQISNRPVAVTPANKKESGSFSYKEKVYLHSNSNEFFAGETILFSVFSLDYKNNLDPVSKIAYVELINDNKVSVFKTPISINNGVGNGEFFIPSSLATGNYHLIGYTRWMLNFDSQNIFRKKLKILNPFRTYINAKVEDEIQVEYLTIGNRLVSGIPNQIYYSTKGLETDQNYTIKVIDNQGETVYESVASKKGTVTITPELTKKYKLLLSGEELKSGVVKELPLVIGYGITAQIEFGADQITFSRVGVDSRVKCIVSNKNSELFQTELQWTDSKSSLSIAGIGHNEIINVKCQSGNGEILYDFFINNLKRDDQKSVSSLGSFDKRSPVILNLDEMLGEIEPKVFSVNIRKKNLIFAPDPVEISKYLSQDSELNNFSKEFPIQNSTTWEAEFGQKIIPDFRGLTLQYANEEAGLVFSSPAQGYYNTSFVDQTGTTNFIIDPSIYSNSYLSGSNELSRVKNISISDYATIETPTPLKFQLDDRQIRMIDERMVEVQVENMYAETTSKDSIKAESFYGTPDKLFKLDEYTRFPTMDEVILEILSGVRLRKNKDELSLYLANSLGQVNKEKPLILINSLPVTDVNEVVNIDPLKIESVEVVREEYQLNESIYGGIIHFIPYKSDFFINRDFSINNSLIPLENTEPSFYQEAKTNTKPDYRSQLVWMPGDENLKEIKFITSDVTGEFIIDIQGVSKEGSPFQIKATFSVEH
ncbi:MAG: hypothetical protein RIM99_07885 [Cyclobacteriaceae bacterium]